MRFLHFLFFITLALFTGCLTDTDTTPLPNNNLTPDTTSHDFMWQIDTIGIRNSILYDVDVIDENNIWAVGQIETEETGIPDSNGIIVPPYNAVHWNGFEWKKLRIKKRNNGIVETLNLIRGIQAINTNKIWFASGSIYEYDGVYANLVFLRNTASSEIAHKFWGNSDHNIYAIGTEGMLIHFDGISWQRIYSGTNLDINDIWGSKNENTGTWEILCVASNQFTSDGRQILRIRDSYVEPVNSDSLPNSLSGIWFIQGKQYFVCGDGLYSTNKIGNNWKRIQNLPLLYKSEIRGTERNDYFITGSFGLISHYNGSTWKHFSEEELSFLSNTVLGSIDYDGYFFVAVGFNGENAIVVRGNHIE